MMNCLPFVKSRPRVNVVRLTGTIGGAGLAGGGLCDRNVAQPIERAFSKGKPVAVALLINSPGGSPVQSSLIAARVRRLAEEKGIPVYAFVEDVAASGGYWLATSADEIFVDSSSILGSIGVISASFGFHELLARQGIERRVHTAGKDKSMLDPFRAERPADVKRLKAMQARIHEAFIEQVKTRRGDRLASDDDLFSGEIWIGQKAIDAGLADGKGHLVPKMKEIFGDRTRLSVLERKKPFFGLRRFGSQIAHDAMGAVEDRALWAQFGL
ncbi:MAG: S49 family peptidase [Paracoccaceae bacterium]